MFYENRGFCGSSAGEGFLSLIVIVIIVKGYREGKPTIKRRDTKVL